MKKCSFIIAACFFSLLVHSQNIGIGVANPSRAKLEVHGVANSNSSTSGVFGGDGVGISFQRNWPTIGFNQYRDNPGGFGKWMGNGFGAIQHFDPASGNMTFEMMGPGFFDRSPALTIRALMFNYSGAMVIGTADYEAALTVARGNNNATAYFWGTTHSSSFNLGVQENTYIRAGKDGGNIYINDIPNGKTSMTGLIGINTSSPVMPLEIRQINGHGLALVEPQNFANWDFSAESGTGNFRVNANGSYAGYYSPGNGAYHQISDARLKTSVQDLSSTLSRFMQLQPVTYEMIDDSTKELHYGFIAQDVKKLFPELVTVSGDSATGYSQINDLHMVDYDAFAVINVQAMQEQEELLVKQSALMQELQKRMREIRKDLQRGKRK